jgi:hypothetical protein
MAAAEIIGRLERQMLALTWFGRNAHDIVPLMLCAILGLQILIL